MRDLRVWFGAQRGDEADEVAALERAGAVRAAVRELLRVYGFPGDGAADEPGAGRWTWRPYTVAYRPSTQLVWAWRRLRALDAR